MFHPVLISTHTQAGVGFAPMPAKLRAYAITTHPINQSEKQKNMFAVKKNAQVEIDARHQVYTGDEKFALWCAGETSTEEERDQAIQDAGAHPILRSLWEYPPFQDGEDGLNEDGEKIRTKILQECFGKAFIRIGYKKAMEGIEYPALQVIATFNDTPQKTYNFGKFQFPETQEQMKVWLEEEFEGDFTDLVKCSCEYRTDRDKFPEIDQPESPDWYSEINGKFWWHENTCSVCQSEYVDARPTNPPVCGHCRPDVCSACVGDCAC